MNKIESMSKRMRHLDIVAGILITYMVYVHVSQFFDFENVAFSKILQHLFGFFMPWFFFKGGMFFRDSPLRKIIYGGFKRLMIPYIIWTIIGVLVLSIIRYEHGIAFNFLTCIKGTLGCLALTGSVSGNLPLWFLLTLYLVRLIYKCSKLCNISAIAFVFVCFFGGLACNYYDISCPKYFANTLTASMFFGGGDLMKSIQYNYKIKWLSIILFVLINCFAYTYVGIRNNVVIEGYYLLWPIFSFSGIIFINNIFFNLEKLKNHKIYQFVSKLLAFIGSHSMAIYVVHWPILLILRDIIEK